MQFQFLREGYVKILSLNELNVGFMQDRLGWIMERSWKEKFTHHLTYRVPIDTGKKTALAKQLVSHFVDEKEGLLWIKDWAAWPNSANMNLFYGYRKSLSESRQLMEAPFHVFSSQDAQSLESLLDLTLYFYWDAILLGSSQDIVLTVSNDEIIEVYARRSEVFDGMIDALSRGLALEMVE